MDKDRLVQTLELSPHPEGGYFKETYRSPLELKNLNGFDGPRNSSTSIYFLLAENDRSHLHRIKSDEVWHFYSGDPLKIVMVSPDGEYSEVILGSDLEDGQQFQYVVPAGYWFGSEVLQGGSYGLAGCTVAPGFDFKDFEMAKKSQMIEQFPQHQNFFEKFCLN